MSDDRVVQNWILDNLDNPAFSKENFVRFEPAPPLEPGNQARFRAVFREGSVEFSNRSSKVELRGEMLKQKLAEGTYANLGDLIGQTHLTEDDTVLIYVAAPSMSGMQIAFDRDREGVKEAVRLIKDEQVEGTRTTFGELLRLERSMETWAMESQN